MYEKEKLKLKEKEKKRIQRIFAELYLQVYTPMILIINAFVLLANNVSTWEKIIFTVVVLISIFLAMAYCGIDE